MPDCYECLPLEGIHYRRCGVRPPELYTYPKPKTPIALLFLRWNSPNPFCGFWSLKFEDNLRRDLHSILSLPAILCPQESQSLKRTRHKGGQCE